MGGRHDRTDDVEKPAAAQRPPMLPSVSAPVGRIPLLSLEDKSQYLDPYIPTAAIATSSTSLAELAHLIRLQGHQQQRCSQSRIRLHRWLVSSALSARLARCGELAHRSLVDDFRSDDKRNFATLYNAIHDVRNSCDATRRYALLEPDLDVDKSKHSKPEKINFSTFMHELPLKIRDDLLTFLSTIRTSPDFLAGRIASLSPSELTSLTAFHQSLDPIDSVMPLQSRGKVLGTSNHRKSAHLPSPVERLLSFQRHDPLSALLYNVFANSSGPDSSEDLRRTDVWSTTCARLIIEGRSGGEHFMSTVLNTWAAMRQWPAKGNLELYLMKALQDGAFLLEKSDDQHAGPRTHIEPRSTKDSIAAEDYFEIAVLDLFKVIDDEPSAGGIPEGVLELGNAILRKLEDPKKQKAAQTFIVSRWFFSTFLLNAIIHPEASVVLQTLLTNNTDLHQTHGIMTGHHITEYARQKILKEIAIRAHKQVLDMTYNWKQAVPILPEIRAHVESILSRFRTSRNHESKPILLPARAITSPRETVEVQPFLVICPSDIVTLVNTLFPDRRPPSSSLEKDLQTKGLRSAASSFSGLSLPSQTKPLSRGGLDSGSLLSNSDSSMTSDTTSREPLLDTLGQNVGQRYSMTSFGPKENTRDIHKELSIEEYGHKLRMSVSEMSRFLGLEATAGSCHPCAERWSILYVSPNGLDLMTRVRKDWNDDEDDEDSLDSDTDEDGSSEKSDLERDYHQMKDAISKLVEDYEIPKELAPESESKEFSNRTSTLRKESKRGVEARSKAPPIGENIQSRNPFHIPSQLSAMLQSQKQAVPERHRSQDARSNSLNGLKEQSRESPSVLLTMLEAAMNQCQARSDFIAAHSYWKTLQQLRRLSSVSLTRDGYAPLLHYFSRGLRDSLSKSASAIEEAEAWFVWLKQSQQRHDQAIEEMILGFKNLRDKMWYVTDVKNSARYEEARNVTMALKMMGQPLKSSQGKLNTTPRSRNIARSATNNFLMKSEAQIMEIMTASAEQGGPNKLADEQAEVTLKWLSQFGIENFCKGEERIHRFCLEIDKCVTKLVGDGMMDGPVLWSSELYNRDKRILDSARQKGDLFLTSAGTLSIAGEEDFEMDARRPGSRSLDFVSRPSPRDLRSMSALNQSQQSFDSGRWSTARSSSTTDVMDSQDYFGAASPVFTIDSSTTFWSPFQTQALSPASTSSLRPRTANTANDTVLLRQAENSNIDKRRFLGDLKSTLTGLLLSDLGSIVWSRGCETDAWFSGDLGEECLQRKEEERRKRKKASANKRSLRRLKGMRGAQRSGPLETLGRTERGQLAAPIATLEHAAPESQSAEENSSSSDVTATSSGMSAAKKAGLMEFPYNIAFRHLLRRFSTHPNPFTKLQALYELELLIIASLTSRAGQTYVSRREASIPASKTSNLESIGETDGRENTSQIGRAKNLDEAIANCEERRSYTMACGGVSLPFRPSSDTRSPHGPPSTDMIVDVLQGLFHDSSTRPKTLFRDLQYIASFVPAHILDKTDRGKAFWDAGLAALGVKQEVCRTMVEIADDIVAYHTKNRGQPPAKRSDQSDELARFGMEDAAKMWTITAKEGDPVAERELAIFYLTHPDLLPRTTLPLTMPRNTFKAEMMYRRNEDPTRSDPHTMCVALHWMELSSQGGDKLARKYLRAREELNAIP
ncbi:MAG: hypothetical protein M1827_000138 [Pycnora praestabilis]|nr:MAG: hypothetical protein M1827_000138 [Pycnora praestabilis]